MVGDVGKMRIEGFEVKKTESLPKQHGGKL